LNQPDQPGKVLHLPSPQIENQPSFPGSEPPTSNLGTASLGRQLLLVTAITIVVVVVILRLWNSNLNIPFSYESDGIALAATVKGLSENFWFLSNPSLGAPFGQSFADYPMSDYLHLLCLKALTATGQTFVWAMNVYFLVSFPLTSAACFWVLRRWGVSFWPGLVSAILFSVLPYHLYRGVPHLFLSTYFVIPIVFYIALRLAFGDRAIEAAPNDQARGWWRRRPVWATVLFTVVVAGTGIYSVFFAMVFIALGACYGAVRYRTLVPVRDAVVIAFGLTLCTLAATLPTLLYAREHGPNAGAVDRRPGEAELYGLRVTQLLMPIPHHRIAKLAELRHAYDTEAVAIPVNENGTASLGIVGSVGFIFLLVYLLGWHDRSEQSRLLPVLSVLNVWAVLLATIGGFSSLIALLVTPKIRGYNRISPYIAFLALAAVAIFINALLRKGGIARRLACVAMPVVLIGGVLDQTSNTNVPDYVTLNRAFAEDRQFIQKIEQALPPGAMVFQLPYIPWPEYPAVHSLPPYDLFRGYLHSHSLRWSYAAMRGRPGDVWVRQVSSKPVSEMIDTLAIAGFSGIYIDRRGYPDQNVEQSIREVLGQASVVAADTTRIFFALGDYARLLRAAYSDRDWVQMRAETLHPTVATWVDGCSIPEGGPDAPNWRWCENDATLALYNSDNEVRQMNLRADVSTGLPQASTLTIEAGDSSRTTPLSGRAATPVTIPITLRPGTTFVRFHSDAKPLFVPGDARKLVLRFAKFDISDGGPPATFTWEGCWGQETGASRQWRWCSDAASLTVNNPASGAKQVAFNLSFHLASNQPAQFQVMAPGYSSVVESGPQITSIQRVLSIPSGVSRIQMKTNAKPITAPGDPRNLVFRVVRFHVVDLTRFPVLYAN
jgi:phosphoglycerol transferase